MPLYLPIPGGEGQPQQMFTEVIRQETEQVAYLQPQR